MAKEIVYEWDWEKLDANGDVVDHHHSDKPEDKPFDGIGQMVLVRDYWDSDQGLKNRQWAYVGVPERGKMPERFDGGAIVPEKYIRQFEEWKKAQKLVKRISRDTGMIDSVAMDQAVEKLAYGMYNEPTKDDKDRIRESLELGATLHTCSYLYERVGA